MENSSKPATTPTNNQTYLESPDKTKGLAAQATFSTYRSKKKPKPNIILNSAESSSLQDAEEDINLDDDPDARELAEHQGSPVAPQALQQPSKRDKGLRLDHKREASSEVQGISSPPSAAIYERCFNSPLRVVGKSVTRDRSPMRPKRRTSTLARTQQKNCEEPKNWQSPDERDAIGSSPLPDRLISHTYGWKSSQSGEKVAPQCSNNSEIIKGTSRVNNIEINFEMATNSSPKLPSIEQVDLRKKAGWAGDEESKQEVSRVHLESEHFEQNEFKKEEKSEKLEMEPMKAVKESPPKPATLDLEKKVALQQSADLGSNRKMFDRIRKMQTFDATGKQIHSAEQSVVVLNKHSSYQPSLKSQVYKMQDRLLVQRCQVGPKRAKAHDQKSSHGVLSASNLRKSNQLSQASLQYSSGPEEIKETSESVNSSRDEIKVEVIPSKKGSESKNNEQVASEPVVMQGNSPFKRMETNRRRLNLNPHVEPLKDKSQDSSINMPDIVFERVDHSASVNTRLSRRQIIGKEKVENEIAQLEEPSSESIPSYESSESEEGQVHLTLPDRVKEGEIHTSPIRQIETPLEPKQARGLLSLVKPDEQSQSLTRRTPRRRISSAVFRNNPASQSLYFMGEDREDESMYAIPLFDKGKSVEESFLNEHKVGYERFLEKMKLEEMSEKTKDEFTAALDLLKEKKMKCFKYNYALQDDVQNCSSFQAWMKIVSDDEGDRLVIINRKPVADHKWTVEVDPELISREKAEERNKNRDSEVGSDYLPSELDESQDQIKFEEVESSASCYLKDIEGFIFGGLSSRFWMLRKHIISTPRKDLDKLPFYSWNCITLQLKNRDVPLVIRREEDMLNFLRVLIYSMKTINCQRGTALPLIKMVAEELKTEAMQFQSEEVLLRKVELQVLTQALRKIKIMIFRNKISYCAFEKNMTIPELLITRIQTTYLRSVNEGLIEVNQEIERRRGKIFNALINNQVGLLKKLMQCNAHGEFEFLPSARESIEVQQQVEVVKVFKNGQEREVTLDKAKNESLQVELNRIFSKNEVLDLFKDIKLSKKEQFESLNHQKFFTYKMKVKTKKIVLNRIHLFLAINAMRGSTFLAAVLHRIRIEKELFLIELEEGKESRLTKDLCQDHLPQSFRYYDSILNFISENISPERKEFYGLKLAMAHSYSKKFTWKNLFFSDDEDETEEGNAEKLILKRTLVNSKKRKEINHHTSKHAQGLQSSKFIQIDDDIDDDRKFIEDQDQNGASSSRAKKVGTQAIVNTLNLKFCKPEEVMKNRKKMLLFKLKFAQRQSHVKNLGQKISVISKFDQYFDDNDSMMLGEFKNLYLAQLSERERDAFNANPDKQYQIQLVKSYLMKLVYHSLTLRRDNIYRKKLDKLKTNAVDQQQGQFHKATTMLDKHIEYDYLYFSSNRVHDEILNIQVKTKKVLDKLKAKNQTKAKRRHTTFSPSGTPDMLMNFKAKLLGQNTTTMKGPVSFTKDIKIQQ